MSIFLDTMDVQQIALAIDEVSGNVISAYSQLKKEKQYTFILHPQRIATGLTQFLDVMYMIEMNQVHYDIADDLGYEDEDELLLEQALSYSELTEIGNYGLELMQTLSEWTDKLQLADEQQQLQSAMIVVSLWIARHGGSLITLNTVSETLAEVVKAPIEPVLLNVLCEVMGELIQATSSEVKSLDAPGHLRAVWCELNMSWGMLAVRTKDIDIMQRVFDCLVKNIPTDVSTFFEQTIMHLDCNGFPIAVQAVIKSYYQRYTVCVLH